MAIEPYRRRSAAYDEGAFFGDGHTWGDPLQPREPEPRRRPSNSLVLRMRRAKTDPNWSTYSAEVKQLLIDRDREAGL